MTCNTCKVKDYKDKQIERLEIINKDLIKDLARTEGVVDDLRNKRFVRFGNEDCWIYDKDDDNDLESLVCPVVIDKDVLIELLSEGRVNKIKAQALEEFAFSIGPFNYYKKGDGVALVQTRTLLRNAASELMKKEWT